jgi:hypothetical protein
MGGAMERPPARRGRRSEIAGRNTGPLVQNAAGARTGDPAALHGAGAFDLDGFLIARADELAVFLQEQYNSGADLQGACRSVQKV